MQRKLWLALALASLAVPAVAQENLPKWLKIVRVPNLELRYVDFGWSPEGHLRTDGPYAETKEQLADFFLVDCETRDRAEEVAAKFAQPGGTVELRPSMWGPDDDQ